MKYNTVLFDADGTLLDFCRSEREALTDALGMRGISADDEVVEVYSRINDRLWKMLEKKEIERRVLVYRRFELLAEHYGYCLDAKEMARDYMDIIATKGYLIDGVCELLDSLYGCVRMYIITNGAATVQRGRYAITGIERYFDGIFISEEVGFNKPDVRYFERVEAGIPQFDKSSTLVVGDSLSSDIKGGNNFGVDTCLYCPLGESDTSIALPTYVAKSYDEVRKIILG